MLAHQNNVVSSCMAASATALIVFTLVTEALNLQTVMLACMVWKCSVTSVNRIIIIILSRFANTHTHSVQDGFTFSVAVYVTCHC